MKYHKKLLAARNHANGSCLQSCLSASGWVFALGLLVVLVFTSSHIRSVPVIHTGSSLHHAQRARMLAAERSEALQELLPGRSSRAGSDLAVSGQSSSERKRFGKRQEGTAVQRHLTKLNVHLLCHSHHDPGWLKTYDQSFLGVRNDYHARVGPHLSAVQYELDAVVHGLLANPDRKFVYGEMSFFRRWYEMQELETQERVKDLVQSGQLDFAGGGWVSNDEAICHFEDIIDQMSLGHRWLSQTFGYIVRQHWQLDVFGHSGANAALAALSGMDSMFFSRLDKEDMELRKPNKQLEFLWRGSPNFGGWGDIWSYALQTGSYYMPEGLSLGHMDQFEAHAEHVMDDVNSTEPLNVERRVDDLVAAAHKMAADIDGNDIAFTMGGDFDWLQAFVWFRNLDKLINAANKDGRVHVMYSTPRIYADAKKSYNKTWPLVRGDMFPYGDCIHCYWTGYFTSRPSTKLYSRMASGYLRAARQLEVLRGRVAAGPNTQRLMQTVALMQHHDAITGTDRMHVNQDYRRLLAQGIDDAHRVMNNALRDIIRLPADMQMQHCTLLNISVCTASVASSARGTDFGLLLYNSLASERSQIVRVPVTGSHSWQIRGAAGQKVAVQVMPQSASTARVVSSLTSRDPDFQENLKWVGDHELLFVAKVPPMGFTTYRVQKGVQPPAAGCQDKPNASCAEKAAQGECGRQPDIMHANCPASCRSCLQPDSSPADARKSTAAAAESVACKCSGPSCQVSAGRMQCQLRDTNVTRTRDQFDALLNTTTTVAEVVSSSRTVNVTNGVLTLTLEGSTDGVLSVARLHSPATGDLPLNFTADMVYYEGGRHPSQQPWVVRPSGQYVFHPTGPAKALRDQQTAELGSPIQTEIVVGPLVSEVRQHFSTQAQLVTRLHCNADYVEMEWTVGPLVGGMDVSLRIETGLDTGEDFWTDANSMEMVRRRRWRRGTFAAAELDDKQQANPLGGNYYPITSAIFLRDSQQRQLTLITDRGQGASSMRSGQLEVMLNRRTSSSDELGNPEKMDETEAGQGVVARGVVRVSVLRREAAVVHRRQHSHSLAWPLLPVFLTPQQTVQPQAATDRPAVPLALPKATNLLQHSMLAKAKSLPPQVHLLTLLEEETGMLLLRLAHIYQATEDGTMAVPARVDLSSLFADLDIVRLREMSLTGSHAAADRTWPNREWKAGDPMYNVDPQLVLQAAQSNSTIPVPEGFDKHGRWVAGPVDADVQLQQALAAATHPGGRRFGGTPPVTFPTPPLPVFDAEDRGWAAPQLTVVLAPSEIRTFEIVARRRTNFD